MITNDITAKSESAVNNISFDTGASIRDPTSTTNKIGANHSNVSIFANVDSYLHNGKTINSSGNNQNDINSSNCIHSLLHST